MKTPYQLHQPITSMLSEYLDGFVLVGFVAGTGEPILVAPPQDPKTQMALNCMIVAVPDLIRAASKPSPVKKSRRKK